MLLFLKYSKSLASLFNAIQIWTRSICISRRSQWPSLLPIPLYYHLLVVVSSSSLSAFQNINFRCKPFTFRRVDAAFISICVFAHNLAVARSRIRVFQFWNSICSGSRCNRQVRIGNCMLSMDEMVASSRVTFMRNDGHNWKWSHITHLHRCLEWMLRLLHHDGSHSFQGNDVNLQLSNQLIYKWALSKLF